MQADTLLTDVAWPQLLDQAAKAQQLLAQVRQRNLQQQHAQ
jgi:hypothetical protein